MKSYYEILVNLIITSILFCGCSNVKEESTPEKGAIKEYQTFNWGEDQAVPWWRDNSSIKWYRAEQQRAVIEESLSTGRPILCYISFYIDRFYSEDIETRIFGNEGWADFVSQYFVTWEVNYWEDPALSLLIAGRAGQASIGYGDGIPGLYILRPKENDSDSFEVLDSWRKFDLENFPVHDNLGITPPSSAYKYQEIGNLSQISGMSYSYDGDLLNSIEPAYVRQGIDNESVELGNGYTPINVILYLAYQNLANGQVDDSLIEEVLAWKARSKIVNKVDLLHGIGFDLRPYSHFSYFPFDYYIPGNLRALECAIALNADFPIDPKQLFGLLYEMTANNEGGMGGGFSPYIHEGEAFEERIISIRSPHTEKKFYGPRDLVWANAYILSLWLKLTSWDTELAKIELPNGQKTDEYLGILYPSLLQAMEVKSNIDQPEDMRLADRIHMLDLYITIYQANGDMIMLDKAGTIADTFSSVPLSEWYDLAYAPLMSDLAIALNNYGYLAQDKRAIAAARIIPLKSLGQMVAPGSILVSRDLLFAQDLVRSSIIMIVTLGSIGDPRSGELLLVANQGWDPRKICQILDPDRDKEMIYQFELEPTETPTAFVFINEEFYSETTDPEELKGLIKEVQEKLGQENTE